MSTRITVDQGKNRRRSALGPTLVILAALIVAFVLFCRIWTDYLWYRSLDATEVFNVQLLTTVGLFAAFGGTMALAVAANMVIAYKLRPRGHRGHARSSTLEHYRSIMDGKTALVIAATALILGVFTGTGTLGNVHTFLGWVNATPFGQTDFYFGRDVSFFVFDLPWWQLVVAQAQWIIVISIIVTAMVHFVTGAFQTNPLTITPPTSAGQPPRVKMNNPFTKAAQSHLAILMGFLLVAIAVSQWLGRYSFAISDNDALFTGIGYTDAHSRITAKLIMAIICLVCAGIFFVNAKLRRWILPTSAVVLAVVSSLVLQAGYPGIVQQFDVRPNEPDRERPYISHHIEATNTAYGLSDVEIADYQATTSVTAGQLIEDASALPGIRLMDPQVIAPTFEQLQQVRGYYAFPDVLDVDRYTIDGQETDAIIAVREINVNGLPTENQSWNNIHTVYTHGYAMVGAYGNRRQASGEPDWIVRDIPPVGELEQVEPRVYFGEQTTNYSVVGVLDGADPLELDTPGGNQDSGGETYTTYSGTGGVAINNFFKRAAFATRFADINLLLSSRVNSQSRILFDRTPMERVAKVAPWLNVDQDPFPAIVDGRVVWILDGYTTSNSYPNSQRVDLETATSDSSSTWSEIGAKRTSVNYMRNSVKAVVDAHDGTVTLYAWDTDDPLLQTWSKVYPSMLHPMSEISTDLLNHLRYPQDMFKVQRDILSRYHMTDPMAWYQQSDLWRIPRDPRFAESNEPPYYLSIKWPGDTRALFSQTAVFVPNERDNLGAYMAVVADAANENYGKIRVLRLSDTHQVPGPNQTFNAIQTDQRVQQALLPFTSQGAAEPVYGNLLTLPLGGGLIYVEPIYTRGKTEAAYPVLRFIVVRFGDHIGIGDTLQEALDMVFEGDAGVDTGEGAVSQTASSSSSDDSTSSDDSASSEDSVTQTTGVAAAQDLLNRAAQAFDAADEALKSGDLAEYQRQTQIAQQRVEEAEDALR